MIQYFRLRVKDAPSPQTARRLPLALSLRRVRRRQADADALFIVTTAATTKATLSTYYNYPQTTAATIKAALTTYPPPLL